MKRAALSLLLLVSLPLPLVASVSGTVVGPDGAPLAGARVAAFQPLSPSDAIRTFHREPVATTTTNKSGAFTLNVSGYGLIGVHVSITGFAPAGVLTALDEPVGNVTLRRAADTEGSITAHGKPVANASVMVIGFEGIPLVTTTNAVGKYHVPDPKVWARTILVLHPDYAPAWHEAGSADFVLESGREIRGSVIDANGKPAAGVSVDLDRLIATTTDSEGTFTFQHAPQGIAVLEVRGKSGMATARVAGGGPSLKLQPASHVSVSVHDSDKHSIRGIAVSIGNERFEETSVTDATGTATVDIPHGQYALAIGTPGQYVAEPMNVDASADVNVDCSVRRQEAMQGVVRSEDGKPVSGAAIHMFYEAQGMSTMFPTGKSTGVDGSFRVYGQLEPRARAKLVAIKPGMPPAFSEVIAAGKRGSPVTITLRSGTRVSGRVVGEDGKPIAEVRIDPVIVTQSMFDMALNAGAAGEAWATTDADGRFSGRLTPETKGLSFFKDGYTKSQQAVALDRGMKPIAVVLARGSVIAGRVVNADGSPAAEVPVAVDEQFAFSGPDGSFVIEHVEPGPHTVHFGRASAQRQTVNAPVSDLTLMLPALRSVRGRVVDAITDAPINQFTVAPASSNEFDFAEPFQSATGEFTFDVPATAANLRIQSDGYLARTVPLDSEDRQPLIIKLSRGRTLRGRVMDERQQPVAGADIEIMPMSGEFRQNGSIQTRADGSFEVAGIDFDSEVRVSADKDEYVRAERKLKPGREDVTIDLVLLRGLTVTGRVVGQSGAGVSDVNVMASSAVHGAGAPSTQTDESGSFRLTGLTPGRYDFRASRPQSTQRGVVKDVDVEKVHELTIRLVSIPAATVMGHVSGLGESASMNRFVSINPIDGESGDFASAPIDIAGNYRVENVPAGTVEIYAMAFSTSGSRTSKKVTVELAAGSETRADLEFTAPVAVRGHVFRGQVPLAGASVRFSASSSFTAVTDPGGGYQGSVDAGEYDVTISAADGKEMPFAQHVSVSPSSGEFDFHINTASVVASVVDLQSGQPIAGAAVTASRRGETHALATATTSPDGSAALDVAAGQALTLTASKSGFANAAEDITPGGSQSIVLRLARTAGAVVRLIDVRDGSTLSGYVIARDSLGRVVASANETDPDGTVTLPVAQGQYAFSGSAEGFGSHTVRAAVPSGEIRIPLRRGGNLVIRSNGEVRGTARLIQPDGEEYVRCWCNGIAEIKIEGRTTLVDRIAPGPYILEVTLDGEKPKRYPVTVIEGQTTGTLLN